jgi:hypothetical protein
VRARCSGQRRSDGSSWPHRRATRLTPARVARASYRQLGREQTAGAGIARSRASTNETLQRGLPFVTGVGLMEATGTMRSKTSTASTRASLLLLATGQRHTKHERPSACERAQWPESPCRRRHAWNAASCATLRPKDPSWLGPPGLCTRAWRTPFPPAVHTDGGARSHALRPTRLRAGCTSLSCTAGRRARVAGASPTSHALPGSAPTPLVQSAKGRWAPPQSRGVVGYEVCPATPAGCPIVPSPLLNEPLLQPEEAIFPMQPCLPHVHPSFSPEHLHRRLLKGRSR